MPVKGAPRWAPTPSGAAVAVAVASGLALAGAGLATRWFTIVIVVGVGMAVAAWAVVDRVAAISAGILVLLLQGFIRRAVEYVVGPPRGLDPFLALLPLVTVGFVAIAARRGAFRDRSPLASAVLVLTVLGVVGALNPLQGSPSAAAIGLVIFVTPVAWFWVGRGLGDDRVLRAVLVTTGLVAFASALYALRQADGRFFAIDQYWIDNLEGYTTIRVGGGTVRPFGFSNSAAEFGKILGYAVVCLAAVGARRRGLPRVAAVVVAVPILVGLALSGLRTTTVLTVVAVALLIALRRRASLRRLVLFGVGGLVALVLAVGLLGGGTVTGSGGERLVARQVSGVADPFDERDSSLGAHVEQVARVYATLPSNPAGSGTATITIAGKRFGTALQSDVDPADAVLAFGLVGFVAYVLLAVRLVGSAVHLARVRTDALALCALGILAVSALQWMNGNLYVASALAWFTFGWMDRASPTPDDDDAPVDDASLGAVPSAGMRPPGASVFQPSAR